MNTYQVTYKTFKIEKAKFKFDKLVKQIVEAYDTQHVKNLIQKNDDIIVEIKQIEK